MKTKTLLSQLALLSMLSGGLMAAPLGTAFTYQSRLTDGGAPASGTYDLVFTLFDAPSGPTAVAGPLTNSAVGVINGLFTVRLDFGPSAFSGDARWLEIAARTNGSGAFATFPARQPLTGAPYALYVANAGFATTASSANVATIAHTVAANAISSTNIAPGQVVKSLNGLHDAVTLIAGANISIGTNGNTLTLAAGGGGTTGGWSTTGNAGTSTVTNFLGTMDDQPLELRVNGQRALRLEPSTNGAPNLIGGFAGNQVSAGVYAATIAGGGSAAAPHLVAAAGGTVGGGAENQALGVVATVGGGQANVAGGAGATVSGGAGNTVQTNADFATIPGGTLNRVAAPYGLAAGRRAKANHTGTFVWADGTDADFASTSSNQFLIRAGGGVGIGVSDTSAALLTVAGAVKADSFVGGGLNLAGDLQAARLNIGSGHILSGTWATIGGGTNNTASGNSSAVGGGSKNTASERFATVGGGTNNVASGYSATVGGGRENTANGFYATIGGGEGNVASNYYATIGGGELNSAGDAYSTVGGGYGNKASGRLATIAGGDRNNASGWNATVAGGFTNISSGYSSAVGGGVLNTASGWYATVGGGCSNSAVGAGAFVGGGGWDGTTIGGNVASGAGSTIGGGLSNSATGAFNAVSGGQNNTASGENATVGGGYFNTIQTNTVASTICGGRVNRIHADAWDATIGGGLANEIHFYSQGSTISGGDDNTIGTESENASWATICGGQNNTNYASNGTISGGYGNTIGANASYAMIPGGQENVAGGDYSLAAGRRAKAYGNGTFVWCDSVDHDLAVIPNNQFVVRASGGCNFWTAVDASGVPTVGVFMMTGDTDWRAWCDRNLKQNFKPVDDRAVLEKVAQLPVTEWNLVSQDPSFRHIGPVAQDFHAAFGLGGPDDKSINNTDAHGVLFAAVKGLNQKLEDKVKEKDAEIQELRKSVSELRVLVNSLVQKSNGGGQ